MLPIQKLLIVDVCMVKIDKINNKQLFKYRFWALHLGSHLPQNNTRSHFTLLYYHTVEFSDFYSLSMVIYVLPFKYENTMTPKMKPILKYVTPKE